MIRVWKWIVPKGYKGITLWPYIFVSDKEHLENKRLIAHEKVHLQQQLEMFIVPFYLWYGIEFLVRYIKCRDKKIAYRNLSFEREARMVNQSLYYPENRKLYAWTKHLSIQ